jgi:hypothetical protein
MYQSIMSVMVERGQIDTPKTHVSVNNVSNHYNHTPKTNVSVNNVDIID